MAGTALRNLTILALLTLFAVSVHSRPCKTFLISSYSFYEQPTPDSSPSFFPSTGVVTVVTEFTATSNPDEESEFLILNRRVEPQTRELRSALPIGFSISIHSFCTRARDIASVAAALLFGIGCGALTASTMYLVWSLWSREEFDQSLDCETDEEDDDLYSPKKIGYVEIPSSESSPEPLQQAL